jgi:hypothetical protein
MVSMVVRQSSSALQPLAEVELGSVRPARFSLERIGDYVGHSSAYMTDAYRHLLEGHEAEAAERFEDYLTRAAYSTPTA